MIKPTIGRIVWFHDENGPLHCDQPLAAIVTRVWSDTMVNLTVFDTGGHPHPVTQVTRRTTS